MKIILILIIFKTVTALLIGNKPDKACHHGWLPWRRTCFMLSVGVENWSNAELRCRALGGYLAEIYDAETNSFLRNHLKALHFNNHTVSYWIGLTDIANVNTWEWSHSRSLPNFTDWHPLQPGNNNQHCGSLLGFYGLDWHDQHCDTINHFVCQENLY
ncbi:Hypothetical predicted protein [Mytilus galloprovincialis]|uniref:C-type lectin domain-containing protein n=1 Tax=Mytilus galloprovincialis TaxID=29158 RepID=A0A8B6D4Z9_MYTGA|nr:Hypothetical predicted protein [Mytilus galloprovincialis]